MGKADDEGSTLRPAGAPERARWVPPFPAEALDLPDEDLVLVFWAHWAAFQAEEKGIPPEGITPEIAEAIRLASLGMDTDSPAMAALEKILRRIAADVPGSAPQIAGMIRTYFRHEALHLAAVDEARTGRRRMRANSRKDRSDALQVLILSYIKKNPALTKADALAQLRREPHGKVIDEVNDEEQIIEWHGHNRPLRSTSFSGLDDRISRARKKATPR